MTTLGTVAVMSEEYLFCVRNNDKFKLFLQTKQNTNCETRLSETTIDCVFYKTEN